MKKVFKAIGSFFTRKPKTVVPHGNQGRGNTHGPATMKEAVVGDIGGRKHEMKPESDVDVLEVPVDEVHEVHEMPDGPPAVEEKFEGHPSKEIEDFKKDEPEKQSEETRDFTESVTQEKTPEKTYPFEDMTDKQKWIYDYMRDNAERFISPSEIGREYGKSKGKAKWGSQHSSKTLIAMVNKKVLEKNHDAHYRFIAID
jgi:hypothetical protein